MKKALITGITGQDGSYLAEFLLEKGCADIREVFLIPLEIAPVEFMHPEAVEMEYAQRNISLLHSLDEGCGSLFVVVGGEGCGQPQTKGPCRRKCRTAGQCGVLVHDLLR